MSEEPTVEPEIPPPPPSVKAIYYAHVSVVHQTARWPSPMRAVDIRYQRQPGPYDPVALTDQYKPRYLHIPALGSQSCRNGEGGGTHTAVDWAAGLATLRAAYGDGLDLVVFCDCLVINGRAHRIGGAIRIAQATGRTFLGELPLTYTSTLPAELPGAISEQAG